MLHGSLSSKNKEDPQKLSYDVAAVTNRSPPAEHQKLLHPWDDTISSDSSEVLLDTLIHSHMMEDLPMEYQPESVLKGKHDHPDDMSQPCVARQPVQDTSRIMNGQIGLEETVSAFPQPSQLDSGIHLEHITASSTEFAVSTRVQNSYS